MAQIGQFDSDLSNIERKAPAESTSGMNNDKQHVTVADINCKNEINVADCFTMNPKSKNQKALSWFLKQKIFFQMICDTKSSGIIFLIGLLFAILSGCSISLMIVFLGRIKHILLTNEPTAIIFLNGIYEQIIILMFVIALAVITHFGMHMSSTVLSDKIRIRLKQRYDIMHRYKYLNEEIIAKIIENVELVEKGLETFEMQCRNAAIIISSIIICFYHEAHLSLIIMSVVPLAIMLNMLSNKLTTKSDVILSDKISQTIQLEKELLLKKNFNDKIANDEHLMRLSSEVRNCTRYAILHQVWKSSHCGILSFTIFTFIGCGMLYGGYLLDANPTMKEGDVFIIVLLMALTVDSISTTITYHYLIKNGVRAALYIWNLQQFDYEFMLIPYGNRHCSMDEIIVKLITVPEFKKSVISPEKNSIIRFISGTRSVLRNYHNHKLFLLFGFILAIIHGFEQAAYNIVIGQIFIAMLGGTPNIHLLTVCAIQLSAIGFAVFISRTTSTVLAAVASEHMAVSFRVILFRQLLKMADKEPFNKSKINTLVDENISLTSEAKSLYHPHLSELMTRITSMIINIILGFIYSWEIALLGLIFIVLCFLVQIEMEFEVLTYCNKRTNNQRIQKKMKVLKSCKHSALRAVNFSIVQTFGFALKAICYALTAFICYNEYKHQAQAFVSVITLFATSQEVVQLPNLIRKLCKSWRAVDQIFAYMDGKSSRNCMSSIPRSIRSKLLKSFALPELDDAKNKSVYVEVSTNH